MLEVVVGLRASSDYTFADSTISDLGNTACRTVRGDVLCSPWHDLMNVGFVWFGCTLAIGSALFLSRHVVGRLGAAAVVAWCVSGAGSVGVGLVPVNEDGALHSLVALPVFLAQPTALLLTGLALSATHRGLSRATLVAGTASLVGVVGFSAVLVTDGSTLLGGLERLALWPGYVWVGALALLLRRGVR